MCEVCEMKANKIAEPTSIPGFIVGNEDNDYYIKLRRFIQPSPLRKYLETKHPEQVEPSCPIFTLGKILKLIEKTVEEEKLYDENNPFIIIGDEDFGRALGTKVISTLDVHAWVVKQLKQLTNPLEDEPDTPRKNNEVHLPKWAKKDATAVKAMIEAHTTVEVNKKQTTSEHMKTFMNKENQYNPPRDTFTFPEMIETILKGIYSKKHGITYGNNHTTALLTSDIIKNALGVKAMEALQLMELVQHQIVKDSTCKIEEEIRETIMMLHKKGKQQARSEPTPDNIDELRRKLDETIKLGENEVPILIVINRKKTETSETNEQSKTK